MEPKPVITYDFNGVKHIQQGHSVRAITGDEFAVFEMLKALEAQGDWIEVRDLCEAQIQKTPEWLTPYLCAGVAHANLGNVEEAIVRLAHVEIMAADNPDYSAATRILNELRKERARSSAQRN
jgi:transcription termination factor NusB